MSIITDLQYVDRIRPYVKNFRKRGNYAWALRCPYCGDSSSRANATKGGIYRSPEINDKLLYACWKCGVSTTFGKLIEFLDPILHDEYKFAEYRETAMFQEDEADPEEGIDMTLFKKSSKDLPITDESLDALIPLSKLPSDHFAVRYVESRKIPHDLWELFYYTNKFKAYTNSLRPGKFEEPIKNDHPRLILPFWNEHGRMFAFAGRSFHGEEPKYFTIKLVDEEEKIYGRERLNYAKPIIVVEGQIDSILLPNAISVSGSSFDLPFTRGIITNAVLVPDNEPRNPQIVALYKKYIKSGFKVCMLPESFPFKDINEAIIGGMTQDEIVKVINDNSYQGLEAEIHFATWNKCEYNRKKGFVKKEDKNSLSEALMNSTAFR